MRCGASQQGRLARAPPRSTASALRAYRSIPLTKVSPCLTLHISYCTYLLCHVWHAHHAPKSLARWQHFYLSMGEARENRELTFAFGLGP